MYTVSSVLQAVEPCCWGALRLESGGMIQDIAAQGYIPEMHQCMHRLGTTQAEHFNNAQTEPKDNKKTKNI